MVQILHVNILLLKKKKVHCLSEMQTKLGVFYFFSNPIRQPTSKCGNCLQVLPHPIAASSINFCWLMLPPESSHKHLLLSLFILATTAPTQALIISSVDDGFQSVFSVSYVVGSSRLLTERLFFVTKLTISSLSCKLFNGSQTLQHMFSTLSAHQPPNLKKKNNNTVRTFCNGTRALIF